MRFDRLGFNAQFTEGRTKMEWLRSLYDLARQQAAQHHVDLLSFEAFWETGHVELPVAEDPPVLFAAYRADPQAHPLKTPSGRIEIFSDTIAVFSYDDCPDHPVRLEPAEWLGSAQAQVYPLPLLSNQPRSRLHSQLDCGEMSRSAKVAQREPVWLNTDDAAARGISNGDVVWIYKAEFALNDPAGAARQAAWAPMGRRSAVDNRCRKAYCAARKLHPAQAESPWL